jgi:hypothetical protein
LLTVSVSATGAPAGSANPALVAFFKNLNICVAGRQKQLSLSIDTQLAESEQCHTYLKTLEEISNSR